MSMSNPNIPLDAIQKIDDICNEGREFNIYSWVPMGLGELWGIINYGQNIGVISPGQTVLDMGSGSGSSSLLWALRGYNVLGIELYKKLADASKKSIRKCKSIIPKGLEIEVFKGSYYPKSYIDFREKGESVAKVIEDTVMYNLFGNGDGIFHPVCRRDVYKRNDLDLKDINIFYAYIWGIQGPSIMEMFKQYARDDATLCLTGKTYREHINQLGLRIMEDDNDDLRNFRFLKK